MMNVLYYSGVVRFQGGVEVRFSDISCSTLRDYDGWYELGFTAEPDDFDKFTIGGNCDAAIIASDGEICFHIEKTSAYDKAGNYVAYFVSNVRERKE